MANTVVITKLTNYNVSIVDGTAKYVLNQQLRPFLKTGGVKVEIKNQAGSVVSSFHPDDVEKVVRQDTTETIISDVQTLFNELNNYFFLM